MMFIAIKPSAETDIQLCPLYVNDLRNNNIPISHINMPGIRYASFYRNRISDIHNSLLSEWKTIPPILHPLIDSISSKMLECLDMHKKQQMKINLVQLALLTIKHHIGYSQFCPLYIPISVFRGTKAAPVAYQNIFDPTRINRTKTKQIIATYFREAPTVVYSRLTISYATTKTLSDSNCAALYANLIVQTVEENLLCIYDSRITVSLIKHSDTNITNKFKFNNLLIIFTHIINVVLVYNYLQSDLTLSNILIVAM